MQAGGDNVVGLGQSVKPEEVMARVILRRSPGSGSRPTSPLATTPSTRAVTLGRDVDSSRAAGEAADDPRDR